MSDLLSRLAQIAGEPHVVAGEALRSRPQDVWTRKPAVAPGLVRPLSAMEPFARDVAAALPREIPGVQGLRVFGRLADTGVRSRPSTGSAS